MTDQGSQNCLINDLVGVRVMDTTKGNNDSDIETTSPWKYPSLNAKKKGTVSLSPWLFTKTMY
jgi:hypothetical protein